jgi:hypothetical protein
MATDLYATGLMFVDGILVAEEVSFTTNFDTKNNVIETQAKGFAGISPGAGTTKVTVVSAVPRAGFELDYYKRATQRLPVEFTAVRGTKKLSFKGFIMTIDEKYGVNQASEGTIDAMCGEPTES